MNWNPVICSTTPSCFNCIARKNCVKRESFYDSYNPALDFSLSNGIALTPEIMEQKKRDELTIHPINLDF